MDKLQTLVKGLKQFTKDELVFTTYKDKYKQRAMVWIKVFQGSNFNVYVYDDGSVEGSISSMSIEDSNKHSLKVNAQVTNLISQLKDEPYM